MGLGNRKTEVALASRWQHRLQSEEHKKTGWGVPWLSPSGAHLW